MRVEELRGGQVGDVALWLEGGLVLPASFHHHAKMASWHTVNALVRFSDELVDGAVDEKIGIVEWWRTIENLVALLTWVATVEDTLKLRTDLESPSLRANVLTRWSSIARWFSNGASSPPKRLTAIVTELRDFRNTFEHSARIRHPDGRVASHLKRRSKLTDVPATANIADLMEAMAICEAAAQFVRFVIPGVDLMPQVVAPSRSHVHFDGLDALTRELLFPLYHEVATMRGLTTSIEPYDIDQRLEGESVMRASMMIRSKDESVLPSLKKRLDVGNRFERWVETRENLPGPGTFGLPHYLRNE